MKLLPKWHSEKHLDPWTAVLPQEPGKQHYHRGVTLTVAEMLNPTAKDDRHRLLRVDR